MKKQRQAEIISIINEFEIENQDMLRKKLEERGFPAAQATLSRDINELGLEKGISGNGTVCYMKAARTDRRHFGNIYRQSVISVDHAGNIVCVKCRAGLASGACAMLDSMNMENVVGTISGDDTIFILMRTENDAKNICVSLKKMM